MKTMLWNIFALTVNADFPVTLLITDRRGVVKDGGGNFDKVSDIPNNLMDLEVWQLDVHEGRMYIDVYEREK